MLFVFLVMGLFGAAALAFAVQNPEPVTLTFLVWQTTSLPVSFVILVSSFIGVLVASISGFAERIQLQLKVRTLEKQVALLSTQRWAATPVREPMRERLVPVPPEPVPAPVSAPVPPPVSPPRDTVRVREG